MPQIEIDDRRRAILEADGHLVVQGGPGSGKTTIALLKARDQTNLLQSEQRVLFLSFSRAAVRQVNERMPGVLVGEVRRRIEVRTFHSFFMELVRSHSGLLTGKRTEFIPPDLERQMKASHDGSWPEQKSALAREGRYVFDMLADTAATLLEQSGDLRALYSSTYPLIIVDEFQDTNVDQWRVIRAMSAGSTVVCLADPDQRIFDFLDGVDEARITEAIDYLSAACLDLTGDNHRSGGVGILDFANSVLRNDAAVPLPESVQEIYYNGPCETYVRGVVKVLMSHLETEVGPSASLAILTRDNQLAGRLSEALGAGTSDDPAIQHELVWDSEMTAAAGYVVASVLEWPTLSRGAAIEGTVLAMIDYFRTKLGADQAPVGSKASIQTLERGLAKFQDGKTVASKAIKEVIKAYDDGLRFIGDPVSDWREARFHLRGSAVELLAIFRDARLLRLFQASDALAFALSDCWDGELGYPRAAQTIREVLAEELIAGAASEPFAISIMSMHKSKGKEFDAVLIVEQPFKPLLDPTWPPKRDQEERRLLRMAITRARRHVVIARPSGSTPLRTTPAK